MMRAVNLPSNYRRNIFGMDVTFRQVNQSCNKSKAFAYSQVGMYVYTYVCMHE